LCEVLVELDILVCTETYPANQDAAGFSVVFRSDCGDARIGASPAFVTLEALEVFCEEHLAKYREIGDDLLHKCYYTDPNSWFWKKTEYANKEYTC
jgi:hypothetical protein